jgi:hypothetical protein
MRKVIKYITGFPLRKDPEIITLDEAITKYSLSEEGQEVWAKQGNIRVPISFYRRYGRTKQDLTESSKILVFIDDELKGIVRFRKVHSYQDAWAGYTKKGVISAEVLDKRVERDWSSWSNSAIRWNADSLIREAIFGESIKGLSRRKRCDT